MLGIFLVLLGYVLGSVPTGYLVGRALGVDVREVGSGNIGTANVLRAAGKRAAILTLAGDMIKGLIPVVVAKLALRPFATQWYNRPCFQMGTLATAANSSSSSVSS